MCGGTRLPGMMLAKLSDTSMQQSQVVSISTAGTQRNAVQLSTELAKPEAHLSVYLQLSCTSRLMV